MTTYRIERFYSDERDSEVIERGLTLEQAQAHCNSEDTHGTTSFGVDWFDGYYEEHDDDDLIVGIDAESILDSESRKPRQPDVHPYIRTLQDHLIAYSPALDQTRRRVIEERLRGEDNH